MSVLESGSMEERYSLSMEMTTADWRWAAAKGFWDPLRRCWIEEMGGKYAYIAQRNQRRAARSSRSQQVMDRAENRDYPPEKRPQSWSVGPSGQSELEGTQKYRRLAPQKQRSHFQAVHSVPQLADTVGLYWRHHVCRKYWTRGYRPEPIIQIFRELPPDLRSVIGEALDAAQLCANAEMRIALRSPQHKDAVPECFVQDEEKWEADAVHGFVQVGPLSASKHRNVDFCYFSFIP